MSELARIRELALRVPVTADSYGPTNTVVDAIWDLEERMQYMLQLLMESQREFAKQAPAATDLPQDIEKEVRARIRA